MNDQDQLFQQVREGARQTLMASLSEVGSFQGRLSSSALSTAVAAMALLHLQRSGGADPAHVRLAERAIAWLEAHPNRDGGYGDTVDSPSNISTTLLVWVALGLEQGSSARVPPIERWLEQRAGGLDAESITAAVRRRYGKDLTFSVPILTACALGGRFGPGRQAWRTFPPLPFELAAFPLPWFRKLGMPVVSYALPALIALGQIRHRNRPTRNPLTRLLRFLTRKRTLRVLTAIQPESGGYLEAAPLTSFVLMSLVGLELGRHPVARRALSFLEQTVRDDGSWPIDTNLETWTTTLAIKALAGGGELGVHLDRSARQRTRDWLLAQQNRREHPYTHAPPGGWAWTDLSGGVPDGDDTPGALLALHALHEAEQCEPDAELRSSVEAGLTWLLDLQNRDGGIPTFCRGFGRLPFDRSCPDLTAHTLRAFTAWADQVDQRLRSRLQRATPAAVRFLMRTQRTDGAWVPLWFGNQQASNEENPLYGTTQVLRALAEVDPDLLRSDSLAGAAGWLVSARNEDGGFGAEPGVRSSIEETGLALGALAATADHPHLAAQKSHLMETALPGAVRYLAGATEGGRRFPAAPIGLYFASLWYSEDLYPVLFTVAGLERVGARSKR